MVDLDGSFEFSDVKSISLNDAINKFNIYPTTAKHLLKVALKEKAAYNLEIFSIDGTLMATQYFDDARLVHDINIRHYSAGCYIIKFNQEGQTTIKRFLKEK